MDKDTTPIKEATGFRPQDLSGYQTFVENPHPQDQLSDGRKQRLLPSPPWGRSKPVGTPSFNGPGGSGSQPDGKSLSKDKPRTLGTPGEDSPPANEPASTMVRSRPINGAQSGPPFPTNKQEEQKGDAKRYYHRYYQKNRNAIKRRSRKWFVRHKMKPRFKKDKERRREYPIKFERRPAGGFREPAVRSQEWREDQKTAARVADFYYKKFVNLGGGWYDRASPSLLEENSEHKHPAEQLTQPAVPNGGPGKTIPQDLTFVNRQAGMFKDALRIAEIEALCDNSLKEKAQSISVKLRRVDTRNLMWLFEVPGSKKGTSYKVHVKGIPVGGNTRDPNKMDVLVSCTCPYWQWQGPEHWAATKGYLYGSPEGTAEAPEEKDPSGTHGACKHALAVLSRMSGFVLPGKRPKLGSWRMVAPGDIDIIRNVVARYLLRRGK